MAMYILTSQEVMQKIEKLNPKGWIRTDGIIYCKDRPDICAIIQHEEKGFDSIFLLWKDRKGEVKNLKIGSYKSKNFLTIKEITRTQSQIVIEVENNGRKFGSFWISIKQLDLKDNFS